MSVFDRFSLQGRTAVVTGASQGIGAAIAEAFAEAGASVVVSSRKQPAVDEVKARITERGGTAYAKACHMGSPDDIEALAAFAEDEMGGVDILVNNAATNPVFGPLLDVDEGAFDKIFDVNLKGPFLLAKRLYPRMSERGHGSIINLSSIGGLRPEPFLGMYSVSKAAILSLTQVMAKEWGGASVRANAICPGLVQTKFSKALWTNEDILEQSVGPQPIARMATPDEMVGLALFLASDASSYSTGGVFVADGGHTI